MKFDFNSQSNPVAIYDPEGNLLGITDRQDVFDRIRAQIKSEKLEGYSFGLDGVKYQINSNGSPDEWPQRMFYNNHMDILCYLAFGNEDQTLEEYIGNQVHVKV